MIFATLQGKRVRSLYLFVHVSVEILSITHSVRIKYPDAFYEGRCVVDADHERPFIDRGGGSQLLGPKGELYLGLWGEADVA